MKTEKPENKKDKSIKNHHSSVAPLSLREAMNRLFDESIWDPFDYWGSSWPSEYAEVNFPRVDIAEDEKEILVTASIPGIDSDDIEIELDQDSLVISGESGREEKKEGKSFYLLEREHGRFRRVLSLPARVETGKVSAEVKNGVLEIKLPKTKESGRRKIEIKK
jgi:HSP20 family protein